MRMMQLWRYRCLMHSHRLYASIEYRMHQKR